MAAPVQPADPRELYLRGLVAREAFQRWLAGEVLDILDGAFRELVARLVLDDLTPAQRERLARLFVEIDRRLREAYGEVGALTERMLTDYGGVEAEAAAADLRARIGLVGEGRVALTTTALTQPVLTAIARLPIQGLTLGEWWEAQAAKMSQATRRAIQTGLTLGETTRDIVKRIIPDRGSTSPAVWRAARAEATMIVRTSITAVHAEAALTTYARAGDDITGEYELVTARDSRVSKICAALDGRRFRYDDPKRLVPPFHPNCVLGDCLVSPGGRIAAVSKRWFDGEVLIIRTASGCELACTPNHPVLTRRGWVPAQALHLGEDVVYHPSMQGPSRWGDHHHQHMVASIEEIAQAWFQSPAVRAVEVPVAAPDFHGDGAESEVAVIGAHRALWDEFGPALTEHPSHLLLKIGVVTRFPLSSGRAGDLLGRADGAAADSLMGPLDQAEAFLRRGASHAGTLLLMAIARGDAGLPENAFDGRWGDTKPFGYPTNAYAALKEGDDVGCGYRDARGLRAWPHGDVGSLQRASDRLGSHPQGSCDRAHALAGAVAGRDVIGRQVDPAAAHCHPSRAQDRIQRTVGDSVLTRERWDVLTRQVAFDRIVAINRRRFSGHVYNLETEGGFYLANGIVTHNCRTVCVPVINYRKLGLLPPYTPRAGGLTFQSLDAWLRAQPRSVQKAILGATRADWYRAGRLSLRDLIDTDTRVLTLEELRRRLLTPTG